jgi:ribonuclease HI
MALIGASNALQVLGAKGSRMQVLIVSDSEYLVKGMRLWVPNWEARGWKRTAGPIENLQLWQELVAQSRRHQVQWTWVRGHAGHPKNEYVNDLAVAAAREKRSSGGAVESQFSEWLVAKQAKKKFVDYDPDTDFQLLQSRLAAGEEFPSLGRVGLREGS